MDILSFTTLFKFILIGVGILGVIVLLMGLIKTERELIQRGVYLIIISVVLTLTSFFILRKTEERAMEYVPTYFEETDYGEMEQDYQ